MLARDAAAHEYNGIDHSLLSSKMVFGPPSVRTGIPLINPHPTWMLVMFAWSLAAQQRHIRI